MSSSNLARFYHHNLVTLKSQPLAEISGSLGDLGTLLPLMIALAIQGAIDLPSTLVFSGLWNVLTGFCFGLPLPVQPMKAIAAVAISRSFTLSETISAGFLVSGVVGTLSITGLLKWFTNLIPIPVVKGIQVGAGLSLVVSAGTTLLQPLRWDSPWENHPLWALFAYLALLITFRFTRFPFALVVFIVGLVLALLWTANSKVTLPRLDIWHPVVMVPSWDSFKIGAIDAGLGQIPLTTLNSVIAVCYLAEDLGYTAPSVTAVGTSVALMNLIGGWFGAMPVCHGSGGLAGQHRFGARSGSSIILLGILKIVLGMLFGKSLIGLLEHYPTSLLGIMVLAAGLELAQVGESLNHGARDLWESSESATSSSTTQEPSKRQRPLSDQERKQRWTVMLMTVGGLLAFKNDAVGFLAGLLTHLIFHFQTARLRSRYWHWPGRESPSNLGEEESLLNERRED